MEETPVWPHMVSDTTVDTTDTNTATIISTGYEKSRVSVCLAVEVDGKNCLQWLSSRMHCEKSIKWIKNSKIL